MAQESNDGRHAQIDAAEIARLIKDPTIPESEKFILSALISPNKTGFCHWLSVDSAKVIANASDQELRLTVERFLAELVLDMKNAGLNAAADSLGRFVNPTDDQIDALRKLAERIINK